MKSRCAHMCSLFVAWFLMLLPAAATAASFSLPQPEGLLDIGAWAGALETDERDALTATPDDTRRLELSVWYPAMTNAAPVRPWASSAMGAALAEQFPFPAGFEGDVLTHTREGPPAAPGPFPVVVFSHGLSFPTVLYQSFFEELTSHGYVVIAIGHPHGASLVEYPDGSNLNMDAWPEFDEEMRREQFLAEHADVWADDIRAVIDWAMNGAIGSPIAGRLDTKRLALVGHSYGGTASGRLTHDPRVAAVVVMEGKVRDPTDEEYHGYVAVGAPLMHLIGGFNRLEYEGDQYRPSEGAPVYQVVIDGGWHAQFSDLIYLYSHYADADWRQRHRYDADSARVLQIVDDYLLAFLDRYLNGVHDQVLLKPKMGADRINNSQESGYSEVDLTITTW